MPRPKLYKRELCAAIEQAEIEGVGSRQLGALLGVSDNYIRVMRRTIGLAKPRSRRAPSAKLLALIECAKIVSGET